MDQPKKETARQAHGRLSGELGRPPTSAELGAALCIPPSNARARASDCKLPLTRTDNRRLFYEMSRDDYAAHRAAREAEEKSRKRDYRPLPLSRRALDRLDEKIDQWRSRVPPGLI